MTVENLDGLSGLARLDATQQCIATGEQLPPPMPLAQVVRELVPTRPTNRQRRDLKLVWPGLKELAQQESSQ